jgi:hypothetical protein
VSAQGICEGREGFEPGPATARLAQRYEARLRELDRHLETLRTLTKAFEAERASVVELYAETKAMMQEPNDA